MNHITHMPIEPRNGIIRFSIADNVQQILAKIRRMRARYRINKRK